MMAAFSDRAGARTRSALGMAVMLVVAVCALAFSAATAHADFGITSFRAQVQRADGSEETRAGAHPYVAMTEFNLNQDTSDPSGIYPDGMLRNVAVDLPAGFVGDPDAIPACPRVDALGLNCSPATQVGLITLRYLIVGTEFTETVGVYNMVRARGEVANFGFTVLAVPINIKIGLRSDGDYGVRATISNISQAIPVTGTKLMLWGVPADPSHDPQRGGRFDCFAEADDPSCAGPGAAGGFSAGVEPKAFLTNPTLCGPPVDTRLAVSSWERPDVVDTAVSTSSTGPTDCNRLVFEPRIDARPDSTQVDAATGLAVRIHVPFNPNPNGLATPTLRRAVVTLPQGVTISPAGADGLVGCTDAQAARGTLNPITCPSSSKIGDAEIVSPVLSEPLIGAIYIGEPLPNQMFRIFLTADNTNYGISIRLEGKLYPDPVTGQVKAVFEDNPALPFSDLTLRFKGGPRAPLSTPVTCGPKTTVAEFTPWADPNAAPVVTTSTFTASFDGNGAPCPLPGFAPAFDAGTINAAAGQDTSFTMSFGRADRQQFLKDVSLAMPEGLTGRIASTPLCGEAQAAAGSCGEESRIGTATVGSGAGASPLYLGGKVYLTGPYKGGPFGLSIVVPAKAGPFDLGLVVVRAAIFVDRNTTALRIVSDPMPSILDGVDLRIRNVNVTIDKPGFMINPTNCKPKAVNGSIGSLAGAIANVSKRFQVAGCAGLPFKPTMTLKVGAKGKLTAGKRTPLEVTLTMPRANTNNRSVQVTLPLALNARLDVVNKRRACTLEQFSADRCPMVVGTASAVTPLLRDPLKGNAYFVYTPARRLPDLVVRLKGQVDVDLIGKVTITKALRLQTTFDTVPDVPITRFRLSLASGGTNGPVGATRSLCSASVRKGLKAELAFVAQSGRKLTKSQQIAVSGCGKARKKTKK